MMLVRLVTPTETATYEGCAFALTMATFDHKVQLLLGTQVFTVLMQSESRLHGMIKSLSLYDIPPAWLIDNVFSSWLFGMVAPDIASQIDFIPESFDSRDFQQILTF